MKKILPFFLILLIGNLISCSSKKTEKEVLFNSNNLKSTNFIEGKITVVGNEPFTNLGLIVNDSTIYILDCDKKTKKVLLSNQGRNYKVFVNTKEETKTGIKYSVIKAELISK